MLLLDIQDINELLVLPAKELWSKTLNHSFWILNKFKDPQENSLCYN
jgi:hypothetical protein